MLDAENQQFDLPNWAQQNYPTVAKILRLVGYPQSDSILKAAANLCTVPQLVIDKLWDSNRRQLLSLLEDLQLFQGRPLPQAVEPQCILMPGQPLRLAVEILRSLVGHSVTCVSNFRYYNPGLDGSIAYIDTAIQRFAGSRWHNWFGREQDNQYTLTSLAAMIAYDGGADLVDAFPGSVTDWEGNLPFYSHVAGDAGETMTYGRPSTTGSEQDDIGFWIELAAGDLEFDTSGAVVIATDPMMVESTGFHAQQAILSQWPNCTVYVTAPEIPESERPGRLADAVQALGNLLLYASA